MSEQDLLSVYHQLFDDAKNNNIDQFIDHLSPTISWHEPKGSPSSQKTGHNGEYHDREGVREHIKKFRDLFDLKHYHFTKEYVVDGNKVISFGSTHLESKDTHKDADIDFVCECSFKGDKIDEFCMYRDTAIEQSLLRA